MKKNNPHKDHGTVLNTCAPLDNMGTLTGFAPPSSIFMSLVKSMDEGGLETSGGRRGGAVSMSTAPGRGIRWTARDEWSGRQPPSPPHPHPPLHPLQSPAACPVDLGPQRESETETETSFR